MAGKTLALIAGVTNGDYPRAYAYVPADGAKIVTRRARRNIRNGSGTDDHAVPPEAIKRAGAGFGSPEANRKVEAASVAAVSRHFLRSGFTVKSREKECLGYDLDVAKGRQTLHVEVKGVSGAGLKFPITYKEVECAKRDRAFRLAVVTNALNVKLRRIELMTGTEFLRRFNLRELSYIATPKKA